jgi:hypothetical protein
MCSGCHLQSFLGRNLEMWEFQVVAMKDSYRVLRYYIRGHGRSAISPSPHTVETLGDDVVSLLDYLDIQRTHFVGLSLGGMIGRGPRSTKCGSTGKSGFVRYHRQRTFGDGSNLG